MSASNSHVVRLGTGLVLVLTGGCRRDIEPIRWQAIDDDAIVAEIENPTAPLTQQTLDALADSLFDDRRALLATHRVITAGLQAESDPDAGLAELPAEPEIPTETTGMSPAPEGPDVNIDLSGTSVFLRVGCPGPTDDELDPAFGHGTLRLDSASLSEQTLDNLLLEGDVLGQFMACQTPDGTIDGRAPLHYQLDPPLVIVDAELSHTERPDGLEDLQIDVPYVAALGWLFSQRPLDDGRTFTFAFSLDDTEPSIIVYGADGRFICDARTMMQPCVAD